MNDPPKAYHGPGRTEPGKEICGADVYSRTDSCTKQLFFAIKEIQTYTGESRDNSCKYPAWYNQKVSIPFKKLGKDYQGPVGPKNRTRLQNRIHSHAPPGKKTSPTLLQHEAAEFNKQRGQRPLTKRGGVSIA